MNVSHGLTRVVGAPTSDWTFIKLGKKSGATLHEGDAKYTSNIVETWHSVQTAHMTVSTGFTHAAHTNKQQCLHN